MRTNLVWGRHMRGISGAVYRVEYKFLWWTWYAYEWYVTKTIPGCAEPYATFVGSAKTADAAITKAMMVMK